MTVAPLRSAPPAPSGDLVRLLEQERESTLRQARRWFPGLPSDEVEDLYQTACEILLTRTQETPDNLPGYLRGIVYKQGLMELRRRRCRPALSLEDGGERELIAALPDPHAKDPATAAAEHIDDEMLRDVARSMPARARQVVVLRYEWGLTPAEIESVLGISGRQYRRELEKGMAALEERMRDLREGEWCKRHRSTIAAIVAGIATPKARERTQRHLTVCPACNAHAARLRDRARALAGIAPMPVLLAPAGGIAAVWGAVTGVLARVLGHGHGAAGAGAHGSAGGAAASAGGAHAAAAGGVGLTAKIAAGVATVAVAGGGGYAATTQITDRAHGTSGDARATNALSAPVRAAAATAASAAAAPARTSARTASKPASRPARRKRTRRKATTRRARARVATAPAAATPDATQPQPAQSQPAQSQPTQPQPAAQAPAPAPARAEPPGLQSQTTQEFKP